MRAFSLFCSELPLERSDEAETKKDRDSDECSDVDRDAGKGVHRHNNSQNDEGQTFISERGLGEKECRGPSSLDNNENKLQYVCENNHNREKVSNGIMWKIVGITGIIR